MPSKSIPPTPENVQGWRAGRSETERVAQAARDCLTATYAAFDASSTLARFRFENPDRNAYLNVGHPDHDDYVEMLEACVATHRTLAAARYTLRELLGL